MHMADNDTVIVIFERFKNAAHPASGRLRVSATSKAFVLGQHGARFTMSASSLLCAAGVKLMMAAGHWVP